MRVTRVLIGLLLLGGIAAPVRADAGITGAVAATYLVRTVDAGLQATAQARAVEISCPGCFNHNLARPGTAEVIAYNRGHPDPVGSAVEGWRNSAGHHRILSDTSLGRIGCARAVVGDTSFFVCVLASGALPAPAAVPPAPVAAPAAAPVAAPVQAETAGGTAATRPARQLILDGPEPPTFLPDTSTR